MIGIGSICTVIILIYVSELEKKKCKCSRNWMRDFIKYMSISIIVFSIILVMFPNIKILCKNNILCRLILKLYALLIVTYLIILIAYYFDIKNKLNCKCSENWKRYLLLYPIFIIPFSIIFFSLFFSILFISTGRLHITTHTSRNFSNKKK